MCDAEHLTVISLENGLRNTQAQAISAATEQRTACRPQPAGGIKCQAHRQLHL